MPAETYLPEKWICFHCVQEDFLRRQIQRDGGETECFHCLERRAAIPLSQLAEMIELAIENHFSITSQDPDGLEYVMSKEGGRDWERNGDPIGFLISDIARIEEDIAEAVRQMLEEKHYDHERAQMGDEGPFDESAQYVTKRVGIDEFLSNWEAFEQSLKTEARYFSASARSTLSEIFENLHSYRTPQDQPVIVPAGPSHPVDRLFRARVFQSWKALENGLKYPDREIGPPPAVNAAAGRMNARGISVFYGATHLDTAVAEVRPPVGSDVLVGEFELTRPLRLLDVRALNGGVVVSGSYFDPAYLRELERTSFLQHLSNRITRPVMPDDETFDYLATQVIADYLSGELGIDGIM